MRQVDNSDILPADRALRHPAGAHNRHGRLGIDVQGQQNDEGTKYFHDQVSLSVGGFPVPKATDENAN